ncbi:MAG TPA: hypothetical protein VK429_09605 [Patescibacteria group bacterium]|nr:hypothetical protein [Patescibacteria group bacterium]
MKIIIAVLFIGLLLSVSSGVYQSPITFFSGFDSTTPANVVDEAITYCGSAAECLVAIYHDFMASSTIMYVFNHYLPPDQNSGRIMLIGFGLVGLAGYGRRLFKK